jgi:glutathione S-transferase
MADDADATLAGTPDGRDQRLRLHFSPGACSRVTLIALEQAGAEYTSHLVSLKDGDQRAPDFRALNPKGKVPVLETPQGILTENVAILVYLAGRYPQADLLPAASDWERATALSMLAWFASTIHPLLTMLRYPERFCDTAEAPGRVRTLAGQQLQDQVQVAETRLQTQRWLLGERWSVADAYLFWSWGRCAESGVDPRRFPRLADHHARMTT